MKIFLSTADQSGDYHGSLLAAALRRADPSVELCGVGGDLMAREGVTILVNPVSHAVVGFFEVLGSLAAWREYLRQAAAACRVKPDLIVLIDSPSFNLRLARRLSGRGYRFAYYISPQVWAWGAGRTRVIASFCQKVLVIFPFEEAIYRAAGAPVSFVGHPFLDTVCARLEPAAARRSFGLDPDRPLLLLLPGSRLSEVRAVFPVMAESARRLAGEGGLQVAVYAAGERVAGELRRSGWRVLTGGDKYGLFASADLALAASGSVTLELTLLGTPFLVLYRLSELTYAFIRPLIKVPCAGITNILAGRRVVPEFIQHRCDARWVVPAARRLLADEEARRRLRAQLLAIGDRLGPPGAVDRAARALLSVPGKGRKGSTLET